MSPRPSTAIPPDLEPLVRQWGRRWGVPDLPEHLSVGFSERMTRALGRCHLASGRIRLAAHLREGPTALLGWPRREATRINAEPPARLRRLDPSGVAAHPPGTGGAPPRTGAGGPGPRGLGRPVPDLEPGGTALERARALEQRITAATRSGPGRQEASLKLAFVGRSRDLWVFDLTRLPRCAVLAAGRLGS